VRRADRGGGSGLARLVLVGLAPLVLGGLLALGGVLPALEGAPRTDEGRLRREAAERAQRVRENGLLAQREREVSLARYREALAREREEVERWRAADLAERERRAEQAAREREVQRRAQAIADERLGQGPLETASRQPAQAAAPPAHRPVERTTEQLESEARAVLRSILDALRRQDGRSLEASASPAARAALADHGGWATACVTRVHVVSATPVVDLAGGPIRVEADVLRTDGAPALRLGLIDRGGGWLLEEVQAGEPAR
jgi:hypothetical protein